MLRLCHVVFLIFLSLCIFVSVCFGSTVINFVELLYCCVVCQDQSQDTFIHLPHYIHFLSFTSLICSFPSSQQWPCTQTVLYILNRPPSRVTSHHFHLHLSALFFVKPHVPPSLSSNPPRCFPEREGWGGHSNSASTVEMLGLCIFQYQVPPGGSSSSAPGPVGSGGPGEPGGAGGGSLLL